MDPRSTRRWRALRAAVLAASTTCHLCGRPGADTVDHLVPVRRRPDLCFDPANLRPAHRGCNAAKGDRLLRLVTVTAPKPWAPGGDESRS